MRVTDDRTVNVNGLLLQFFGINVLDDGVGSTGPVVNVISNLSDRQRAANLQDESAVLNRPFTWAVAHDTGSSHVELIG